MKRILTSFALVAASLAFAQVSIAPSEVTPKATLDIEAMGGNTADGILIPRVDRARAQAMTNVEKSTLIYVNSIANGAQVGQAVDVDAEGFYYFNGAKWAKLGSGNSATSNIYDVDGSLNGPRIITQNNNNITYSTGATGSFIVDGTSRLNGSSYVKTTIVGSATNPVTTYDVAADDYYIAVQSTAYQVVVNVPLPQDAVGRVIIISNDASQNVAINSNGTQALNGTDSPSIAPNRAMWIISDGKRWFNLINF